MQTKDFPISSLTSKLTHRNIVNRKNTFFLSPNNIVIEDWQIKKNKKNCNIVKKNTYICHCVKKERQKDLHVCTLCIRRVHHSRDDSRTQMNEETSPGNFPIASGNLPGEIKGSAIVVAKFRQIKTSLDSELPGILQFISACVTRFSLAYDVIGNTARVPESRRELIPPPPARYLIGLNCCAKFNFSKVVNGKFNDDDWICICTANKNRKRRLIRALYWRLRFSCAEFARAKSRWFLA